MLLLKIFMNLQCMKYINLILKTDKRHCMPHLYIHATLYVYSTYRLVVPYFGNDREDPILMTFLFLKLSKSACWAKRLYETAKRNNLSCTVSYCSKLMKYGNPSSNVYRSFLSAVIRTLNPFFILVRAKRLCSPAKQNDPSINTAICCFKLM